MRSLSRLYVAAFAALCGCGNSVSIQPSAAPDPALEQPEIVVKPEKLAPPPGNPGPILVRTENLFPNQMFATAATESHIAFAMQSDARDVSLCPKTELPICFLGSAVIAKRVNPNRPKRVILYESDTQSGSRVDDVAADGSRFAFAVREGLYTGDTLQNSVLIVDQDAAILHKISLDKADFHIGQMALTSDQNGVTLCHAFSHDFQYGVQCYALDMQAARLDPQQTLTSGSPVRSLSLASANGKILLAWTSAAHAYIANLGDNSRKIDLGPASAMRPQIAAGIDSFAIAWQSDDGRIRIESVPFDGNASKRQTLTLNGLRDQSIQGLSPVSDGFLFAFRHNNTQQIALVAPDFKSWQLVENPLAWRAFHGLASVDITDAHTGKWIWQTAESLLEPALD